MSAIAATHAMRPFFFNIMKAKARNTTTMYMLSLRERTLNNAVVQIAGQLEYFGAVLWMAKSFNKT